MRCMINNCLKKNGYERPPFDFIYSQLSSSELNFLEVEESDKDEIHDYIDRLQENETENKISNEPQKIIEISSSMNSIKSTISDISMSGSPSTTISQSMIGSKYGLVLNEENESINKLLISERKSYSRIILKTIISPFLHLLCQMVHFEKCLKKHSKARHQRNGRQSKHLSCLVWPLKWLTCINTASSTKT